MVKLFICLERRTLAVMQQGIFRETVLREMRNQGIDGNLQQL